MATMEIPQMTQGICTGQAETQLLLGISVPKLQDSSSHSYGAVSTSFPAGKVNDDIETGAFNSAQSGLTASQFSEEAKQEEPALGNDVSTVRITVETDVNANQVDLHVSSEAYCEHPSVAKPFEGAQKSSISVPVEVAPSGADSSGIEGEFQDVMDGLAKELHDGDRHFFDMALTRSLSLLPEDLQGMGEQGVGHFEEKAHYEQLDSKDPSQTAIASPHVPEATNIPPSACILLATAVISLSSIGPLLQFQTGASGCMKILWRQLATSIMLSPFAIRSILQEGFPRLSSSRWTLFLVMATCYTTSSVGFALSLEYTSVGNAVILSNSHSVLLLAGKLLVGDVVDPLEATGAVVAFTGATLCSKDAQDVASTVSTALLGDFLGLLSGIGGVGYLVAAKSLRPEMNLIIFMTLNMLVGSAIIAGFMVLALHEQITLGTDPTIGIFGWLQPALNRFPLEIAIVLVCNVLGTLGYVRAMRFFDNIVIAVAGLLEPVVAELLSCLIGVGTLPGWKGWTGNALVLLGTVAVVWPSSNKLQPQH